jgi:hypothetical protein
MQTTAIAIEPYEAGKLYRQYLTHREHQTPVDAEVQRIYHAISKGRTVIRAMASITAAGLNDKGLPKLCIAPAESTHCFLRYFPDGSAIMAGTDNEAWARRRSAKRTVSFLADSFPAFPRTAMNKTAKAVMPIIPPMHRPKRGLANYHVLWEAEWLPVPPRDPLLLRRIGVSDAWLVLAAWDLTAAEQAVMATRIR